MPEISVIIPNYNHDAFLQQRVDSVFQQTYTDFEVIILDDASTDNSREVIERYRSNSKITHILYNPQNGGSTFLQWQKGISAATGNYIWLAESDDVAAPQFLENCIKKFNADDTLVLVYSNSRVIDERNAVLYQDLSFWYEDLGAGKWQKDYTIGGKEEIKSVLSKKNTIPNASAVLFKQSCFRPVSGFRFLGDWLTWIKILEQGNISFINTPLNSFRSHSKTTRHQPANTIRFRQFIKERSIILNYLATQHLIEPHEYKKQHDEILHDWKNVFTLKDLFGSSFYIPFGKFSGLSVFLIHKLFNAFKRLSKKT